MATSDLTPEALRSALDYDPETGLFRWRFDKARVRAGDVAGGVCKPLGYVQIVIAQKHYYGHRLAWFYTYGRWPDYQIDHINGERADNRLCNLREVSWTVNHQNRRSARSDSVSQVLGVHKRGAKWRARLKTPEKQLYLGSFDTADEAHAAYLEAKRKLHAGCTI